MSEAYAKVIDLIAADGVDFRFIALELAKACPEAFLAIHGSRATFSGDQTTISQDDAELLTFLRSGRKVEAIKTRRAKTGEGLKEAKDYCDALDAKDKSGELTRKAKESKLVNLGQLLREKLGVQANGEVKTAEPTW